MNMNSARVPIIASHQSQRSSDTQLQGRRLLIVRIVWVALVLFTLWIFIVSLPENFAILHVSCSSNVCTSTTGQLTMGDIQTLRKLSLSLDAYATYWIILNIIVALGWFAVAGFLAWRKSDNWLTLLVALMLVNGGASSFASTLVFSSSIWRLPANGWYLVDSLAVLFAFALFPNGRFVPRWFHWILLIYPIQLLCYLVFLRELHLPGWSLYHSPLNAVCWFGSLAALTLAQIYRYLRVSNQVERQQTKWIALSFVVLLVASFGNTAVENLLSIQQIGLLYILIVSLFTCIFLSVPLSFGVAILRYHLWDIDLIINRSLVYGTLTVCVVGLYVLIVGYLGVLFRTGSNLLISLIATGLIAVLFQPLRERLQRAANRLIYGERDEPYTVISRLGQRMEATLAPDAVLPAIVETVAQALKLPYAAILLQHESEFKPTISYGKLVGEPLLFPLVYQGETIGTLHLAPRTPGEDFTPADMRLLNELTRQVSLAAHAVSLTADLQRSNEHLSNARLRLVTAREEERRRLRRDLHDGLGPTLAALTLKVGAARKLLSYNPIQAEAVLHELNGDIETTIGDIRRLVYNLRPPALDELGLVGAIRERVTSSTIVKDMGYTEELQVTVDAPDTLPSLPAAVEVAAYRIVQEALTNVTRHAHAHICHIHLWFDEMLFLEICDNGIGLVGEHHRGVGIHSMYERATELGGTCKMEPMQNGGTRVYACLPIMKE